MKDILKFALCLFLGMNIFFGVCGFWIWVLEISTGG
jgi:hypothetical protein